MPLPSLGIFSKVSKGLASKTITPTKNKRNPDKIETKYGSASFNSDGRNNSVKKDATEIINPIYSKDPSFPAYIATQV